MKSWMLGMIAEYYKTQNINYQHMKRKKKLEATFKIMWIVRLEFAIEYESMATFPESIIFYLIKLNSMCMKYLTVDWACLASG